MTDSKDPSEYIDSALEKYWSGDYTGAIDDLNKVIKIDPNNEIAYNKRGNAKYGLKDIEGAKNDYENAIRINHKYKNPYYNRGNLKYSLGDEMGAIDDYNKAIEIDPEYAWAYNNRGRTKFSLGDYQGAMDDFNMAIYILPQDKVGPTAYTNLGMAKFELGDYEGAIYDYAKAIKLDKNEDSDCYYSEFKDSKVIVNNYSSMDPMYHMRKAERRLRKDQVDKRSKPIETTVDAFAYIKSGDKKMSSGDYQGAIDDVSKAIEIDPSNAYLYYKRGNIKCKLENTLGSKQGSIEDFNSAIKLYTEKIELDPKDHISYQNRARTRECLGDPEGAIHDYTEAIDITENEKELNLDRAECYRRRGNCKLRLGDKSASWDDRIKADELDPPSKASKEVAKHERIEIRKSHKLLRINRLKRLEEYFSMHEPLYVEDFFDRAELRVTKNDYKGAVKDLTRVIREQRKNIKAYENRAYARRLLGDLKGAIKDLIKIINIEPNNADILTTLGDFRKELGEYQIAIDDYTKALEVYIKQFGTGESITIEKFEASIVYCNRGSAKQVLGDIKGACEDWKKASELDNKEAPALIKKYCTNI